MDSTTSAGGVVPLSVVGHPGFTEQVEADDRVKVILVDDQAPFRTAGRAVLDRLAGFEVIAEAESGEEAVALAASIEPDLVLMDINMGGIDGLDATLQITEQAPEVMVILMSTYAVEDLPAHARTCGAAAYLNKDELTPRRVRQLWEAGGDPSWRVQPT